MAFCVALVAMPWPLPDRPSIQLGALKAYLKIRFGNEVRVKAHHPYLLLAKVLGWDRYRVMAERSWIGEAAYAALLNPGKAEGCFRLMERLWPRQRRSLLPHPDELNRALKKAHREGRFFDELADFDMVGVSVCFAQLASSLFLAKELKRRRPLIPVVFGGSLVCGTMGRSLMEACREIDYVVSGEGEEPLAALVHRLKARKEGGKDPVGGEFPEGAKEWPGIFSRGSNGEVQGRGRRQVIRLDDLPSPDYDDFFGELRDVFPGVTHLPLLPVEMSRGCWWHRAREDRPHARACRFCNLNVQWKGYRSKSPSKVVEEIRHLVDRHKILRIAFVDNTPNPIRLGRTVEALEEMPMDLDLFMELRAPLDRDQIRRLRRAGLKRVQVGIEALDEHLLRRMGKGTRLVDNIAVMRHLEEWRVENRSNLLMEFPGCTAQEVERTLAVLDFVEIYQPLRGVRFWLGHGSPVAMDPGAYGIGALRNHTWYHEIFSRELVSRVDLLIKDYRGDRIRQRKRWAPVWRRLEKWRKDYTETKSLHGWHLPLLGYVDGGEFLIVRRRRRATSATEAFRLVGTSRAIYLACRDPVSLSTLAQRFPRVGPDRILAFLEDLVSKKILYWDGRHAVALAVSEDADPWRPVGPGDP